MLFSVTILISLLLCGWSLLTRRPVFDYFRAIVMTLVFSYLLSERISLVGTAIIVCFAAVTLILLFTNLLTTSKRIEYRNYKPYWGKFTVAVVLGTGIVFIFKKIIISNLIFNPLEFNEDYLVLMTLFFASILLKKNKEV